MKGTIILFGKPNCPLCKFSNEILSNQKIASKYEIIRINIATFFDKSKVVEILGMDKSYELLNSIGEKLGNEYVLVFRYDDASKQMAYIPFKKYIVIGQISQDAIDFDKLLNELETIPYNILLKDK
ncbi:glutaredoxin [Penguinpox virus]|uniref:Glutaredoxin-2 n=3 Tax=Avipoxvirus TaxID=10260 RepID=A0A068EEH4_9POXV|nr:glutaredoxin [Penguinpox virus]YP_009046310.1 glutaredoxin [Pigeonpox virus]YP_009447996.1 glutaredoxin [Flamingopox virus FGPVKD09]WCB86931.1 CPPV120 glutaredoxin [Cooks petrelpox virus]WIK87420.1 glutaredoxin [Oriental turtle dovepox virus]AID46586.1 glutaredoxin [Pigeonpox virus]AID46815.1 glutaredoxin [Penguinpox virus]AUD40181.1 glutaredoxin [Flamingopox virus FGPVKD09]